MPHDIHLLAHAKINLYLHVTGKRADGYHLLDSLTVFAADVYDEITVKESEEFSLHISGPFAAELHGEAPQSNLVTRAAALAAHHAGRHLSGKIELVKNLPMGAGLGGGSADAAMTLKAYETLWGVALPREEMARIGADVPVCRVSRACRFGGIGEEISDIPPLPALSALLIWPGIHAATGDVFAARTSAFQGQRAVFPARFEHADEFLSFLSGQGNDLTEAAEKLYPPIREARGFLERRPACALARMSGSGSCVFGLYKNHEDCLADAREAQKSYPEWWIKASGILP